MTCLRCGSRLGATARFCGACGVRIEGELPRGGGEARAAAEATPGADGAALLGELRAAGVRGEALDAAERLVGRTGRELLLVGEPGRGQASVRSAVPEGWTVAEAPLRGSRPHVLGADAALLLLSAGQLLTATERAAVGTEGLLDAPGPFAVHVSGWEEVGEEDRRELDTRLGRFVAGRVPVLYDGPSLRRWLEATPAPGPERLRAVLAGLELPPSEPQEALGDETVRREAGLAASEAIAAFEAACVTLLQGLGARLAAIPREGVRGTLLPALETELSDAATAAAERFLVGLEGALSGRGDPALAGASAGLGTQAPDLRTGSAPTVPDATRRPRDATAALLAGGGVVSLMALGGPLGILGGGALLLGSWQARQAADRRHREAWSGETHEAIARWVEAERARVVTALKGFTDDVTRQVQARLAELTPPPRGLRPSLRQAVERWSAELQAEAP